MQRRAFLRSLLSTSALIAGGLSLTQTVPAETRGAAVQRTPWAYYMGHDGMYAINIESGEPQQISTVIKSRIHAQDAQGHILDATEIANFPYLWFPHAPAA